MKTSQSRLLRNVIYLNVILTVIAVLMIINLARDFGLLSPRPAQATSIMAVQIESVRGNIPVAIKEPVSGFPSSICVTSCR
jgi:hypothetical protein